MRAAKNTTMTKPKVVSVTVPGDNNCIGNSSAGNMQIPYQQNASPPSSQHQIPQHQRIFKKKLHLMTSLSPSNRSASQTMGARLALELSESTQSKLIMSPFRWYKLMHLLRRKLPSLPHGIQSTASLFQISLQGKVEICTHQCPAQTMSIWQKSEADKTITSDLLLIQTMPTHRLF